MLTYFCILTCLFASTLLAQTPIAFPGAEGFGNKTQGGRGGEVYYVTNLECSGPGSLNDALRKPGKKIIVFSVSGVIDCYADIIWGDCTIAGQTSPGGIIVRGIMIDDYYEPEGKAQNIIIRHLNSRPGIEELRPGKGNVMDDALRLDGTKNIVVDHCSFANATDESVQISRSTNITFSNNILSETLGYHFDLGGMLMNYSTADFPRDSISIIKNLWNRMGGRMPEISCEGSFDRPGDTTCLERPFHIEYSNNLLWDIGIQVYYDKGFSPQNESFHDVHGNFVKNIAIRRDSYCGPMFNAPFMENPGNSLYVFGNTMSGYPDFQDYELFYCCNDFCNDPPNRQTGNHEKKINRHPYPDMKYLETKDLVSYMAKEVGAFTLNGQNGRDVMNARLMKPVQIGMIDTTPVDGKDYFNDAYTLSFSGQPSSHHDSDKDGMPDYWELANGLNPDQQDHNGTNLSTAFFGTSGYTNIDCYLECLSRFIVSGESISPCGIVRNPTSVREKLKEQLITQVGDGFTIEQRSTPARFIMSDIMGRSIMSIEVDECSHHVSSHLPIGVYSYLLMNKESVLESGVLRIND